MTQKIIKQITVTNHASDQLTLNITQSGDFYVTAIDKFGEALLDSNTNQPKKIRSLLLPNTDPQIASYLVSNEVSTAEKNTLALNLIEQFFSKIAETNSRIGIDLEFPQGEPVIILGMGLAGGGFWGRLAGGVLGVGMFAGGVALVVCTGGAAAGPVAAIAAKLGAVGTAAASASAIGAGVSSTVYTVTADEKDFTAGGFAKQIVVGGVTGAVTGGIGGGGAVLTKELALTGVKKVGTALATDVVGGVVGNAFSAGTSSLIVTDADAKKDKQIGITENDSYADKVKKRAKHEFTLKNFAISVISSGVSSGVSQGLNAGGNKLADGFAKKVLNQTDDIVALASSQNLTITSKTTKVVTNSLVSGTAGAASSAAATVTSNAIHNKNEQDETKKRKLLDGVLQSATTSFVSGSVIGAVRTANDYKKSAEDIQTRVEEKRQEILLSQSNQAQAGNSLPQPKQSQQSLQDVNTEIEKTKSQIDEARRKEAQLAKSRQDAQLYADQIAREKQEYHQLEAEQNKAIKSLDSKIADTDNVIKSESRLSEEARNAIPEPRPAAKKANLLGQIKREMNNAGNALHQLKQDALRERDQAVRQVKEKIIAPAIEKRDALQQQVAQEQQKLIKTTQHLRDIAVSENNAVQSFKKIGDQLSQQNQLVNSAQGKLDSLLKQRDQLTAAVKTNMQQVTDKVQTVTNNLSQQAANFGIDARREASRFENDIRREAVQTERNIRNEAANFEEQTRKAGAHFEKDLRRETARFESDVRREVRGAPQNLQKFGEDVGREANKFGGDVAREAHKLGGDIAREAQQVGGHVSEVVRDQVQTGQNNLRHHLQAAAKRMNENLQILEKFSRGEYSVTDLAKDLHNTVGRASTDIKSEQNRIADTVSNEMQTTGGQLSAKAKYVGSVLSKEAKAGGKEVARLCKSYSKTLSEEAKAGKANLARHGKNGAHRWIQNLQGVFDGKIKLREIPKTTKETLLQARTDVKREWANMPPDAKIVFDTLENMVKDDPKGVVVLVASIAADVIVPGSGQVIRQVYVMLKMKSMGVPNHEIGKYFLNVNGDKIAQAAVDYYAPGLSAAAETAIEAKKYYDFYQRNEELIKSACKGEGRQQALLAQTLCAEFSSLGNELREIGINPQDMVAFANGDSAAVERMMRGVATKSLENGVRKLTGEIQDFLNKPESSQPTVGEQQQSQTSVTKPDGNKVNPANDNAVPPRQNSSTFNRPNDPITIAQTTNNQSTQTLNPAAGKLAKQPPMSRTVKNIVSRDKNGNLSQRDAKTGRYAKDVTERVKTKTNRHTGKASAKVRLFQDQQQTTTALVPASQLAEGVEVGANLNRGYQREAGVEIDWNNRSVNATVTAEANAEVNYLQANKKTSIGEASARVSSSSSAKVEGRFQVKPGGKSGMEVDIGVSAGGYVSAVEAQTTVKSKEYCVQNVCGQCEVTVEAHAGAVGAKYGMGVKTLKTKPGVRFFHEAGAMSGVGSSHKISCTVSKNEHPSTTPTNKL